MRDDLLLEVLHDTATAVRTALDGLTSWGDAGTRAGQYLSDLAADEAALAVLDKAGLGAMSEESGPHDAGREIVVVLDPVDGSTNASRDLPWYATSLCAVDGDGARAAVVVDQAGGARFEATRGGGARVDGRPLRPSPCDGPGRSPRRPVRLSAMVVRVEAVPGSRRGGPRPLRGGRRPARRLRRLQPERPRMPGTTSAGCSSARRLGPSWSDAWDRPLVTLDHAARRTPVAAGTSALLDVAVRERRRFAEHPLWARSSRSGRSGS